MTRTARLIYFAIKDDQEAIDELKAMKKKLAMSLVDEDGGQAISSMSINGQQFTFRQNFTTEQQLMLIGLVCEMLERQNPISSRTIPIF